MQKDKYLPDQWLKRWTVMGIFEGIIVLVDTRCPLTDYHIVTSDIYFFCYVNWMDRELHTWNIAYGPEEPSHQGGKQWDSGPIGYKCSCVYESCGMSGQGEDSKPYRQAKKKLKKRLVAVLEMKTKRGDPRGKGGRIKFVALDRLPLRPTEDKYRRLR
jgi:hypothetical protein